MLREGEVGRIERLTIIISITWYSCLMGHSSMGHSSLPKCSLNFFTVVKFQLNTGFNDDLSFLLSF